MTSKSRASSSVAAAITTTPPARRTSKSSFAAGAGASSVNRAQVEPKATKLHTTPNNATRMRDDNHSSARAGTPQQPKSTPTNANIDKDQAIKRARIPFALARDGMQSLVKSKQLDQQQRKQIKEAQALQIGQVKSLVLGQPLWQNDPRDLERGGTVQLSFDRIEYSPSTRGRITSLVRKVRKNKLVLDTSILPNAEGDSVQSGELAPVSKNDADAAGVNANAAADPVVSKVGTPMASAAAGISEQLITDAASAPVASGKSPTRMKRLSGRMNRRLSGRFTLTPKATAASTSVSNAGRRKSSGSKEDRTRSYASLLRSLSPLASTSALCMPESHLSLKWAGLETEHTGPVWTPVLHIRLTRVTESGSKEVICETATEVGSLMSRKRPTSIHKSPLGLREKMDTIPLLLSTDSKTVVGFVTLKAVWHPNPGPERRHIRTQSRRRSSRSSRHGSSSHNNSKRNSKSRRSSSNRRSKETSFRMNDAKASSSEGKGGRSSVAIRKDVAHTARLAAHKKQTASDQSTRVRVVASAAEALNINNQPGSEGTESAGESSEDGGSSLSSAAALARKKKNKNKNKNDRRPADGNGVALGPLGVERDMGRQHRRPTLTARLAMPEDSELDLNAADELPEPSADPARGRADSEFNRRGSVWSDWDTPDAGEIVSFCLFVWLLACLL
jgi:hypothetical protein